METVSPPRTLAAHPARDIEDAPGIVIADGGLGARVGRMTPLVRAFIYGEEAPISPPLPFGRRKQAS
jgi:hypothetical protein